MLNEMLQPTSRPVPMETTSQPGSTTLHPQGYVGTSGQPVLLREGSTIVDRTGWVRSVPDNPYAQFVFDQSAGANIPPMFVLPNLRLMQIEDASAVTKSALRFTVSGTVTEYKGNNYILLESQPMDDSHELVPGLAPGPTTNPASADQMLNEMLSSDTTTEPPLPRPQSSLTDSTSGSAAVSPTAPVLSVVREGSQIIDRTGRLTHTPDGRQSEFTFDSDGSALQDAPLLILPNLKLESMENAVAGTNRDLHFRITGLVTEFRGRNCILLEKVVVIPDNLQQF
ncbi:MAG: hypothetical protein ABSF29_02995, partial [Tepidisphaeraceae bacterium]